MAELNFNEAQQVTLYLVEKAIEFGLEQGVALEDILYKIDKYLDDVEVRGGV